MLAVITEACLGGEDDSVGELHLSDLDRFEEGRNGWELSGHAALRELAGDEFVCLSGTA